MMEDRNGMGNDPQKMMAQPAAQMIASIGPFSLTIDHMQFDRVKTRGTERYYQGKTFPGKISNMGDIVGRIDVPIGWAMNIQPCDCEDKAHIAVMHNSLIYPLFEYLESAGYMAKFGYELTDWLATNRKKLWLESTENWDRLVFTTKANIIKVNTAEEYIRLTSELGLKPVLINK